MKRILKYMAMAGVALSLTSCHIYQKYELPTDSAPLKTYAEQVNAQPDSASLPYLSWEKVFDDPLLRKYINMALENNKDLDNARLNVEMAQAQLLGARLSYLPSVTFAPNGAGAKYKLPGAEMNWTYTLPLALNWEVDIFGKILNNKWKAEASLEMAQDYRQAARSQIICGVANTYYALVLMQQQLQLTRNTAEVWKDQVQIMVDLKQAARVNEAAVVQSRANYYSILATIPDIENQIVSLNNTMSLLLNTFPQPWTVTQSLDFDLPVDISNGLSIKYLASRPDVRAAEKNLAVAYYATNRARANFYPSLNISSNGGFTNNLGSMIVNPGKWFIQLAASLSAPLFSRGANIANLKATKAAQQQALNDFQYSILSASADVTAAMSEIKSNAEKREYVLQQIDQLEKSVEYTQELLTYGQSTYLEVLTARSALLSAQIASLTTWHQKVAAMISLYQAVGGGR